MIAHLRLAPGAGAPNTVRNLMVACRIIAHHEERCAFMSAMSEQWKRDGDQWRRKVASYTKMIEAMPELSENTLRVLWEELEKTTAQQAHEKAEKAILEYAKMVAGMEARAKDITEMQEEKAMWTLRRFNEANNMLQSLHDWWQLQKSLWEGVVAWQMEQKSHEAKYHEAMAKLDATLPLQMTKDTMMYRLNCLVDEGYTTKQEVQQQINEIRYRHLFEDWVINLWHERHNAQAMETYYFMKRHDDELLEFFASQPAEKQYLFAAAKRQIEASKAIYQPYIS